MALGAASPDDARWMAAAVAIGGRGRGLSTPNPNVGCILVREGQVVGRGWTQSGGRPHAESMAIEQAGPRARGATAYVTLEPCVHQSQRGGTCTDALIAAGVARVVAATIDSDTRTNGSGIAALRDAGVDVQIDVLPQAARDSMAGWWTRTAQARPHVTLKLATSLDGCIAMADGSSRWITGDRARAHAHLLRARCDAILVGRTTVETDAPALDVRLPGLETRSPRRFVFTSGTVGGGWTALASPADIAQLDGVNDLLVEGGAKTAAAFLAQDLVDTLVLYRAPIVLGAGRAALGDIGLSALAAAHGRWQLADARALGQDRLEIYRRSREGMG